MCHAPFFFVTCPTEYRRKRFGHAQLQTRASPVSFPVSDQTGRKPRCIVKICTAMVCWYRRLKDTVRPLTHVGPSIYFLQSYFDATTFFLQTARFNSCSSSTCQNVTRSQLSFPSCSLRRKPHVRFSWRTESHGHGFSTVSPSSTDCSQPTLPTTLEPTTWECRKCRTINPRPNAVLDGSSSFCSKHLFCRVGP